MITCLENSETKTKEARNKNELNGMGTESLKHTHHNKSPRRGPFSKFNLNVVTNTSLEPTPFKRYKY